MAVTLTSKSSIHLAVRRNLVVWALLLFALTGLGVLWLRLAGVDPDNGFSPAIILIAYSSSVAAFCIAGFVPGAGGAKALLKQAVIWRVSFVWYALALLGPLALVLFATLLYKLFGGAVPATVLASPGPSVLGPLIAGALGEEFGWRGFAQRLLNQRLNLLWASLIVGVLWATWHSWPALAPGGHVHAGALEVFETYLRLVPTAVIYGWIYVRTGGSVLLVMLAHVGHNIAVDLLSAALLNTTGMPFTIALLYFVIAVILVVARPADFFGPRKVQQAVKYA